jgi:integrase
MTQLQNMGGISQHRGWWVLRYREKVGINGGVKTVMRAKRLARVDEFHKTKASIRKLASDALGPIKFRNVDPLRVTTLKDFVDGVYLPYVERQKRPSTARSYRQIWRTYFKEAWRWAWLREIRTFHIQAWLEEIAQVARKRHGCQYTLSKTTLAHIKNFLSGVFRHAAQQGYFDGVNPVTLAEIPAFAPKGNEGQAYSLEEIGKMLRILPEPSATVVAAAAYAGLRLGELQGLTWDDYTPPGQSEELGSIQVSRNVWRGRVGEPKTEKSKSIVPVIPQLVTGLERFRKLVGNPSKGPMFANGVGKPMDLNALYYRQMRNLLKQAGSNWSGWHGFRRGLASNLNRLGIDDSVIQAILRHSDISVTQRCYIKTARPEATAAMKQFSAKLDEVLKESGGRSEAPERAVGPL